MDDDMIKKVASRVLKEAGRIDSLVSEISDIKQSTGHSVDSLDDRFQAMFDEFELLKDRLHSVENQLGNVQADTTVDNLADAAEMEAMRREIAVVQAKNEELLHRNSVLQTAMEQLKTENDTLSEGSGDITRYNADTSIGSVTVVPRENHKGDWCLYKEVVPIIISYKRSLKQLELDLVKMKDRA